MFFGTAAALTNGAALPMFAIVIGAHRACTWRRTCFGSCTRILALAAFRQPDLGWLPCPRQAANGKRLSVPLHAGNVLNTIGDASSSDALLSSLNGVILDFIYIAIVALIAGFMQMSFWMLTGAGGILMRWQPCFIVSCVA